MEINKKVLEKIMGPIVEGDQEIKVSLFIASKKNPRLKKLNLEKAISPEDRAAKLHKWAQDNRFVAVIEMGDKVFAHAHANVAERLGKQDLAIDGKKVSVKALSEEESKQLSIVGEAFEEFVLQVPEEKEEKENKEEAHAQYTGSISSIRQYLAESRLVSDQMHMHYLIARMQNIPGEVILDCLRRFNEALREEKKRKEENDKYFAIKEREIEKAIRRGEITKEEIKSQIGKQEAVAEDARRVRRTRVQ
jgi:hypothetical protein